MKKYLVMGLALLMACMLGGTALADLNDGLTAYYPFNGNADDESGNGNDGIEYGGVSYVAGKTGQAARFDGVDDFIEIWSADEMNNSINTTEGTVSVWINPDITDGFVYQYYSGSFGDRLYLHILEDNKGYRLGIGDNYESNDEANNQLIPGNNTWYHIVAIWKANGDMETYFNGVLDLESSFGNPGFTFQSNDNEKFYLGRGWAGNPLYYKGIVDDIRIYNRALSESEIQQLFTEQPYNCPGTCSQSVLDAQYEAGKQFCKANPAACGIDTEGGYDEGKQFCIDNPADCGIDADDRYDEGFAAGLAAGKDECPDSSFTPEPGACEPATLSAGLDLHIPAARHTPFVGNPIDLWVEFEFYSGDNGVYLWKLTEYGQK